MSQANGREGGSTNTYAIRSALVDTLGVVLALASGSALATTYQLTDLGTLGGASSDGRAINGSGQVTGAAYTGGNTQAFLWGWHEDAGPRHGDGLVWYWRGHQRLRAAGGLRLQHRRRPSGPGSRLALGRHDLNTLIDPADPLQPSVVLLEDVDINDRGQVVANGRNVRTGESHAYLVSPVPDGPALPAPTPPTVEPSAGGGDAFDVIVTLALLGLLAPALVRRRSAASLGF